MYINMDKITTDAPENRNQAQRKDKKKKTQCLKPYIKELIYENYYLVPNFHNLFKYSYVGQNLFIKWHKCLYQGELHTLEWAGLFVCVQNE